MCHIQLMTASTLIHAHVPIFLSLMVADWDLLSQVLGRTCGTHTMV